MNTHYHLTPKVAGVPARINKHNSFRCFILLFFSCFFMNIAGLLGQTMNSVLPPSPTVAALGKYGDVPVSLYTGIPSITVPLYDISLGDLKLPISLSYHSGGVKVEEVASNVGLGWALNAGGIIGRNIRGLADEGNYWYPIAPSNRVENIMFSGNSTAINSLANDVEFGYTDGEADVFYYNFGEYSGKFIFDQAGVAHSFPKKNLVITPYNAGYRIVTEDGTVYTFVNYEYVSASNCGNDQNSIIAWYLSSITSADGKRVINFIYEAAYYNYQVLLGQVKYFSTGLGTSNCLSDVNCMGTQAYFTHRLQRIDFVEGYVKFNYINGRADLVDDMSLDQVEIYTKNNTLLKRYNLAYSYFGNNSDGINRGTEHTKRLKLNSVTEVTASGNQKPPYLFEYNTTYELPHRFSYEQDFWGYYNGKTGNPNLISKFSTVMGGGGTVVVPGADRKADSVRARTGILTKIKYPTGGETLFSYEGNTVSDNYSEVDVTPQSMYLGENGNANNMPVPYNSFSSLVIPAGGAQVNFYVSGLESWPWPSCDIVQCQVIKDGNPTPYRIIQNSLHGASEFWPAGTYSLRLIYECGVDAQAIFSVTVEALIPNTVTYPLRQVGGLRIKQIEDRPGNGSASIIKTYRYHKADNVNLSSGLLVNFPDFGYDLSVHSWAPVGDPGGGYNIYCDYRVRQSYSSYPMATTQGSYVGYANVIEDLNGNGENWHAFTAYPDVISSFPFAPVENYDWRRGFLLSTKNYARKPNGQLVLVKELINTPHISNEFRVYGIKTGRSYIETMNGQVQPLIPNFTFYPTIAEFFETGQTKERIYDQDDPTKYTETVADFIYNPQHLQLAQIKTTKSSNDAVIKEEQITNRKYAFDYSFSSAPLGAEAQGIKNLQDLHVVNKVIEENVVKQRRNTSNNSLSDQRVVGGSISLFKPDNPYPEMVYKLNLSSPITSATYGTGSAISGSAFIKNANTTIANAFKPTLWFSNYDDKGNIATQLKTDDLPTTYIWGYDKKYPIAEVKNARISDVFYTSFEEVDGNGTGNNAKTGKKFRANGYSTLLIGLSNGSYRLTYWSKTVDTWNFQSTIVTVTNGQYTINLSGELDEIRFYPANAQMVTMTYDPMVGMTSQCDVNNRVTMYEYDGFQRLTIVRDEFYKILKLICYNYAGQAENCPAN